MIGILFILITIATHIVNAINIRKREPISWMIKSGYVCYKCKEDIVDLNTSDYDVVKEKTLCASCERDSKLEEIIEESKINKTKRKFNSLNFFKIYFILVALSLILNLTSIWIKPISGLGSFFLMLSSFSFFYDSMRNSRPKK